MKKTEQNSSIVPDFFEGIPEQAPVTDRVEKSFSPGDFSEMMMEAVYIIDFQKQNFCHVADHGFFLCGHSREDAMNAGYDFFYRVIHPADRPLWVKMHNIIIKRLCCTDLQRNSLNYFSCTFRIKSSRQTGKRQDYLMAYQKLKPIWQNEQLRFGICLLSSSIIRQTGNLRICYKNSLDCEEYVFESRTWQRQKDIPKLTDREKDILKLSKQGKSSKEIAEILFISEKTTRNIETGLYQKLGVHSMIEAVIFATNHRIIFT
jgi:DNA-binding CsgD family transcriptional regulator